STLPNTLTMASNCPRSKPSCSPAALTWAGKVLVLIVVVLYGDFQLAPASGHLVDGQCGVGGPLGAVREPRLQVDCLAMHDQVGRPGVVARHQPGLRGLPAGLLDRLLRGEARGGGDMGGRDLLRPLR